MSTDYDEMESIAEKNHREYNRTYNKHYSSARTYFRIKPAMARKFKQYYDEYVLIQQQNQAPIVAITDFFYQFAEMGFLNWRYKTKGK